MTEELLVDIFSMLILIILLISGRLNSNRMNNSHDKLELRFSIIIFAILGYLVSNSLSIIFEGHPQFSAITAYASLIAFVFVDCVLIAFSFYLGTLLESANARNPRIVIVPAVICLVRIVLVSVLYTSGMLFYVDAHGYYQEYTLSFIPYIFSGFIILVLLYIVVCNRRCFSTIQFVVILIYLCFPLLPILLEMYLDLYSLTSVSMTLATLLIYILVQSSIIDKAKMRESVLEEISYTDLLTGLNNRRSYYQRLSELEANQHVGIIYCDMNNLKYTNDNFGHAAGDKLIQKFANILSEHFRSKDIYRISGDEFVIIISNISKETFEDRAEMFHTYITHNDNISSIGYAHGIGCYIDKLISEAEQNMYRQKRYYHEMLNSKALTQDQQCRCDL